MLRFLAFMIPVFLSLHVSVARVRENYAELPLSSVTDDVPPDENAGERYNLPVQNMAAIEQDENVEFDTSVRSCLVRYETKDCAGKSIRVAVCRSTSRGAVSCHKAVNTYGYNKCKPSYRYYPMCGQQGIPTACVCA